VKASSVGSARAPSHQVHNNNNKKKKKKKKKKKNKVETPIHDNIRELVTWECKEHGVNS
jgi:hypothetical protein